MVVAGGVPPLPGVELVPVPPFAPGVVPDPEPPFPCETEDEPALLPPADAELVAPPCEAEALGGSTTDALQPSNESEPPKASAMRNAELGRVRVVMEASVIRVRIA